MNKLRNLLGASLQLTHNFIESRLLLDHFCLKLFELFLLGQDFDFVFKIQNLHSVVLKFLLQHLVLVSEVFLLTHAVV